MATFNEKTGRAVNGQWSGTSLPSTCTPGDFYIKVDAPLGQRLYTCNLSAVWEAPSGGGSSSWGGITGTLSDQTNLQGALNGKAASSHAHAIGDVTNLTTDLAGKQPLDADLTALAALASTGFAKRTAADTWSVTVPDWTEIANKPSTFTPSTHTHVKADITDFGTYEAPLTFNAPLSRATNTISIPAANESTNGYLASGDWTTFNGKQAALGFTPENSANKNAANGYAGLDAGSKLAASQLPVPGATTLGGVKATSCSGSDKVTGIDTSGTITCGADQQGSGTFPVGGIILIVSGTCPSGFAEETSLSGKFVLGTLNANGDIGTTGGSDTITEVLNHTHPVNVTDNGHAHTQRYGASTGNFTVHVGDTSGGGTGGSAALSNEQTTTTNTTGISATTSDPAGGVASIDNRPAFVKVIFCRKT